MLEKLTSQLIINDQLPKHISEAVGLERPVYIGKQNQIFESDRMDQVIINLEEKLRRIRGEDFYLRLSVVEKVNDRQPEVNLFLEPETCFFKKGTLTDKGILFIIGAGVRIVNMSQTEEGMISCRVFDVWVDYTSPNGLYQEELFSIVKFGNTENFIPPLYQNMKEIICQGRGRLLKKIRDLNSPVGNIAQQKN